MTSATDNAGAVTGSLASGSVTDAAVVNLARQSPFSTTARFNGYHRPNLSCRVAGRKRRLGDVAQDIRFHSTTFQPSVSAAPFTAQAEPSQSTIGPRLPHCGCGLRSFSQTRNPPLPSKLPRNPSRSCRDLTTLFAGQCAWRRGRSGRIRQGGWRPRRSRKQIACNFGAKFQLFACTSGVETHCDAPLV